MWWHRTVTRGKVWWRRFSQRPGIDHLLRAGRRFSDRQGNQFAAAITYFSFLSLVPILMVSFAIAGFVLTNRPDLLDELKDQVASLIPAEQMGSIIDRAVSQRFAVGIVGLLVALYSGLNWMGNVRDAVRAQWRPQWKRSKEARGNFLLAYLWDLISLVGLAIAVVATFALTAVGTAAQDLVVSWLGIDEIGFLRSALRIGPFVVAILANMLIFAWMYTILPVKGNRADRRTLFIGALSMAIAFEILKAALTLLVTDTNPTAQVFGAVIGLLLFFNLVGRAFLMIAAWIATGVEGPDAGAPTADAAAGRAGTPSDAKDLPEVTTVVLRSPPRRRRMRRVALGIAAGLAWLLSRRSRRTRPRR